MFPAARKPTMHSTRRCRPQRVSLALGSQHHTTHISRPFWSYHQEEYSGGLFAECRPPSPWLQVSQSVLAGSGLVWKLLRQMLIDSRPTKTIIHAVLVSISLSGRQAITIRVASCLFRCCQVELESSMIIPSHPCPWILPSTHQQCSFTWRCPHTALPREPEERTDPYIVRSCANTFP